MEFASLASHYLKKLSSHSHFPDFFSIDMTHCISPIYDMFSQLLSNEIKGKTSLVIDT